MFAVTSVVLYIRVEVIFPPYCVHHFHSGEDYLPILTLLVFGRKLRINVYHSPQIHKRSKVSFDCLMQFSATYQRTVRVKPTKALGTYSTYSFNEASRDSVARNRQPEGQHAKIGAHPEVKGLIPKVG